MAQASAVVLAAGASTRMGRPKLILPLDDEPLVRRTVRQISEAGFDDVLVVVGSEHQKVRKALDGLNIRYALNAKYEEGMGSSFRTAVEQLENSPFAMFALADQPFVSAREYRAILNSYIEKQPPIVSSRYGEVAAPPHLFRHDLFAELAQLKGGARPLLERHRDEMIVMQFPPELLMDIDTPEDYERAKTLFSSRR